MDIEEKDINLKQNLLFKEITGYCFEIYNELGEGLLESAYEAALIYVLNNKGIKVESQVSLPIYYQGHKLDQLYRMDLVVNGNTIIELKSLNAVGKEHIRQIQHYMELTHLPYGMLINFGKERVFSLKYAYDPSTHSCNQIVRSYL